MDQGCFTWRHNSVLARIAIFITLEDSSSDLEIHNDAGGRASSIPPDILTMPNRPDLGSYINIQQMHIYI